MQPTKIDLLINCPWIIPIVPQDRVLRNCALAIDAEKIIGIFPQAEAAKRFDAVEVQNLDSHVLMPGLVNAHGHGAMTLLRGYADDLPLRPWLENHIWPAESAHVSEEFVRDGSKIAMAEMIASGTTCFADMYFFHQAIAEEVRSAGMRSQIGFTVLDFPTPYGKDADDYIHKGLSLHDKYSGQSLIKVACAPHAPYSVSDPAMQVISTYANELDMPVHIHCHETAEEITESLTNYGCRPLQRLKNLGLLLPQTQLVHMTQVDAEDIVLIQDHNCHVVHCPESNMKLASGFCPVGQLIDAGINVALGTDGAASNNDLDMFGELKTAALLTKAVAQDAAKLDAHAALRMATINGAKALGWDDQIGSLEAGKSADIIAIEINSIAQQPLYNPASQLVYTNSGSQVTHSWVAGKPLLENRVLVTLNQSELIQSARDWRNKIQPRSMD
ncbi:TRZ/ATZ family hydrolase [SAR92 clade bacterium H921]|jgi:5-methylthioadenosine/S-adenosylhomocysteine deaminase|nr:TRZ/ATZ family hydrolase [SAR92 clade bacterium H921]MDG0971978.1 TRZ/ATZ family hydrolase [Porticoccaceae bacterium]MDG1308624.1 TRZ/ATZ family hydrolase [Porticoccaceae bacterium]